MSAGRHWCSAPERQHEATGHAVLAYIAYTGHALRNSLKKKGNKNPDPIRKWRQMVVHRIDRDAYRNRNVVERCSLKVFAK